MGLDGDWSAVLGKGVSRILVDRVGHISSQLGRYRRFGFGRCRKWWGLLEVNSHLDLDDNRERLCRMACMPRSVRWRVGQLVAQGAASLSVRPWSCRLGSVYVDAAPSVNSDPESILLPLLQAMREREGGNGGVARRGCARGDKVKR